jgi:hypothetical protein
MADTLKQLPFNGIEAQNPEQQRVQNLDDEALEKELHSALENKEKGGQPETQLEQPEQTSPEPKTDATGQDVVKENQSEQVTEPPKQVVEQKPEEIAQQAFDNPELREKKGWKSEQDAKQSYENLEKALHEKAQKLAELRKQQVPTTPVQQPPVQTHPQAQDETSPYYNDPQWRQDTARAFKEMSSLVLGPRMQEYEQKLAKLDQIERQLTYEKLSSSPDTADFVTPEIQKGMIEEYEAHPEWLSSESARTAHLKDAYYIARGKQRDKAEKQALQTGQQIGAQSEVAKQRARVETSSVSTAPTKPETDPMKMSMDDLDRALIAQFKKEGRG